MSNECVRFFVVGDTHFLDQDDHKKYPDWHEINEKRRKLLAELYEKLGGSNTGIIITGDLIDHGRPAQWENYNDAIDGFSEYVYDGWGNHDYYTSEGKFSKMKRAIANRPRATTIYKDGGNDHYSWDWGFVHFVQLNMFPGNEPGGKGMDGCSDRPHTSLNFLKGDLRRHAKEKPVVIVHHFGFDTQATGKASEAKDDKHYGCWTNTHRRKYWQAIEKYNVIAVFTGHLHTPDNDQITHQPFQLGENYWAVKWDGTDDFSRHEKDKTIIRSHNAAGVADRLAYLDVEINVHEVTVVRYEDRKEVARVFYKY